MMSREQIVKALSGLFDTAINERDSLIDLFVQAETEDNFRMSKKISRKLKENFGFVNGIEAAAHALDITTKELIKELIISIATKEET